MKKSIIALTTLLSAFAMNAKTLVAYYSYTNTVENIVNTLKSQIECDVIEVEPTDKNADYNANNYALGSEQIDRINANPNEASSYPSIDPVEVNIPEYDMIIIAMPLWHAQMAAPFQTFLFQYGKQMAGKNVAMIISSWSSGTSGVIRDAKRLIPDGNFIEPFLWDRASQRVDASALATWLSEFHYNDLTTGVASITSDNNFEIVASEGMVGVNGDFTTLVLYNTSGYKVLESTESPVTTDELHPGIYIAQAKNGKKAVTRKINIR